MFRTLRLSLWSFSRQKDQFEWNCQTRRERNEIIDKSPIEKEQKFGFQFYLTTSFARSKFRSTRKQRKLSDEKKGGGRTWATESEKEQFFKKLIRGIAAFQSAYPESSSNHDLSPSPKTLNRFAALSSWACGVRAPFNPTNRLITTAPSDWIRSSRDLPTSSRNSSFLLLPRIPREGSGVNEGRGVCNEERGKRHLILLISSSQNSSRFIQETFSIFFFFCSLMFVLVEEIENRDVRSLSDLLYLFLTIDKVCRNNKNVKWRIISVKITNNISVKLAALISIRSVCFACLCRRL